MFDPDQLPSFFFKSFLESPISMIVADKEQFQIANQSFCTQFGYSPDEIGQLNFDSITPNNLRETPHEDYFVQRTGLVHFIAERYILKKDGQTALVELSWVRHWFKSDAFIIFFIRDITTHKTKIERLYKNEKRLSMALRAGKQAIWDWNYLTGETYYSDDYFIMLGYEPNEFEPSNEKWISMLHPDDVDYATFAQQLYMESKADRYEVEYRQQKKDGTYIWTYSRSLIISRNEEGLPERVMGLVMDIDEQKKKEIAINDLTQKLISFAFYHSHILRSPVANALGLVELMKQEENLEYLTLLEKSIVKVDEVIHKMNRTLTINTNQLIERGLTTKITYITTDKLSRFLFKKLVTKFKANVDAQFYDDIQDFIASNFKKEKGQIVIVDLQSVQSNWWDELAQIQDCPKQVYLFLLTDQISIEDVLKAKSFPFIHGVLLKPLTREDLNPFFL